MLNFHTSRFLIKTKFLSKFVSLNESRNFCDFVGKWRPNPYPTTKEEMEISAKNHNMIVEDYQPCHEDSGMGDYPHIYPHAYENRPFAYDYDYPYRRLNYGEQLPEFYSIDTYAPHEEFDQRGFNHMLKFWVPLIAFFFICYFWPITDPREKPKQFPPEYFPKTRKRVHYTFEPNN